MSNFELNRHNSSERKHEEPNTHSVLPFFHVPTNKNKKLGMAFKNLCTSPDFKAVFPKQSD
jgi:hypothetical protein